MNNIIELKNLSKNYHNLKKINVLKNLNYKFKKGKTYSLVGPSGSGKSTLLNILSLIDRPSNGNLLLFVCGIAGNKEVCSDNKGRTIVKLVKPFI